MASKTFTYAGVNHNWTTAGNWNLGTLPIDNDSVTIPINETCTFDADMSNAGTWPNGIAGITVTGTLNCTNTPGSYYLKIKAASTITGAGTFTWGSTTFTAKHTLTGGAAWQFPATSPTVSIIGTEPTYKYVKTLNYENALATRIEIDTNLTGDIWAVGDTITINNINRAVQSETRIIQAITSTYIDITVGLTASKLIGSYICLVTRNTQVIGVGITQPIFVNIPQGKLSISGGMFTGGYYYCISSCGLTLSGGVFYGFNLTVSSCTNIVVSGGIFTGCAQPFSSCSVGTFTGGAIIGCTYGMASCYNGTINYILITAITYGLWGIYGMLINDILLDSSAQGIVSAGGNTITGGTFSNNGAAVVFCAEMVVTGGSFVGNLTAFQIASAKIYSGVTFSGNTYDINSCSVEMFGVTHNDSGSSNISQEVCTESFDDNGIPANYKVWTRGGKTTTVASPVPSGFSMAYQIATISATFAGWWRKKVLVPAGKTVQFTFYIRKDVSMAYKPRVWVFLESMEPFISGTPLKEFIYPDNTNDTWATDTFSYTNTDNYDKMLIVRFLGKNASGNVFTQLKVEHSMSPRSRILGGVG